MKDLIHRAYVYLREKFPVNRVVALLAGPAATLAGLVSAWLADHLPFIAAQVDSGELTAIFLGAAGAVVVMAYGWLDGWQKYQDQIHDAAIDERHQKRIERRLASANADVDSELRSPRATDES